MGGINVIENGKFEEYDEIIDQIELLIIKILTDYIYENIRKEAIRITKRLIFQGFYDHKKNEN